MLAIEFVKMQSAQCQIGIGNLHQAVDKVAPRQLDDTWTTRQDVQGKENSIGAGKG